MRLISQIFLWCALAGLAQAQSALEIYACDVKLALPDSQPIPFIIGHDSAKGSAFAYDPLIATFAKKPVPAKILRETKSQRNYHWSVRRVRLGEVDVPNVTYRARFQKASGQLKLNITFPGFSENVTGKGACSRISEADVKKIQRQLQSPRLQRAVNGPALWRDGRDRRFVCAVAVSRKTYAWWPQTVEVRHKIKSGKIEVRMKLPGKKAELRLPATVKPSDKQVTYAWAGRFDDPDGKRWGEKPQAQVAYEMRIPKSGALRFFASAHPSRRNASDTVPMACKPL